MADKGDKDNEPRGKLVPGVWSETEKRSVHPDHPSVAPREVHIGGAKTTVKPEQITEAFNTPAQEEEPMDLSYMNEPAIPYIRGKPSEGWKGTQNEEAPEDQGFTEEDVGDNQIEQSSQRNKDHLYPPKKSSMGRDFQEKSGILYAVPGELEPLLRKVTDGDPFSYKIMANILGSESRFKTSARSPTGVSGLAQMTQATLYETLHKIQDLLPPEHKKIVKDNIERYNAAGKGNDPVYRHRIKEGGDRKAISALKKNPVVAFISAREYMRWATKQGKKLFREGLTGKINWIESQSRKKGTELPVERLKMMKEHLERPMTSADVKTFYVCGPNGGSELLMALADPATHNHRAKDYTSEHVAKSNPNVFAKNGVDRNIPDYYKYIESKVGNEPLPENLDRPGHLDASLNKFLAASPNTFG